MMRQRIAVQLGEGGSGSESVEEQTIQEIHKLFLDKLAVPIESPDIDLFETGLLDSLTLVQFIAHLENAFQFRISVKDLELDQLRSTRSIARVVNSRKDLEIGVE